MSLASPVSRVLSALKTSLIMKVLALPPVPVSSLGIVELKASLITKVLALPPVHVSFLETGELYPEGCFRITTGSCKISRNWLTLSRRQQFQLSRDMIFIIRKSYIRRENFTCSKSFACHDCSTYHNSFSCTNSSTCQNSSTSYNSFSGRKKNSFSATIVFSSHNKSIPATVSSAVAEVVAAALVATQE